MSILPARPQKGLAEMQVMQAHISFWASVITGLLEPSKIRQRSASAGDLWRRRTPIRHPIRGRPRQFGEGIHHGGQARRVFRTAKSRTWRPSKLGCDGVQRTSASMFLRPDAG
jgi:hypothetical protein